MTVAFKERGVKVWSYHGVDLIDGEAEVGGLKARESVTLQQRVVVDAEVKVVALDPFRAGRHRLGLHHDCVRRNAGRGRPGHPRHNISTYIFQLAIQILKSQL